MNHYLNVLMESLWAGSIVPFAPDNTYYAMEALGGFNMPLATALAWLGAMLGLLFNWGVGHWLMRLQLQGRLTLQQSHYGKAVYYFNKYGILLLLLTWFNVFIYFALVAGFLRVPLRIALPLMAVGQAAFFAYVLLN